MATLYQITKSRTPVDASCVIDDFLRHERGRYGMVPGIEVKIERLAELLGRLCDEKKIDLTDIISTDELKHGYKFSTEGFDWT